jgi:hypothetical protein
LEHEHHATQFSLFEGPACEAVNYGAEENLEIQSKEGVDHEARERSRKARKVY